MALDKSTGVQVVKEGIAFEELVRDICISIGLHAECQHRFHQSRNLFGGILKADVYIYPDSKRFPDGLIIECTTQAGSGSGYHKLPHKVWTAVEANPINSIIVADGAGFENNSMAWAKRQVGRDWCKTGDYKKLLAVLTLDEFIEWIGAPKDILKQWAVKKNRPAPETLFEIEP